MRSRTLLLLVTSVTLACSNGGNNNNNNHDGDSITGDSITGDSDVGMSDVDGDAVAGDDDNCLDVTNAVEICDGKDNDCDGSLDEGCGVDHCGTIATDERWEPVEFGHYVSCNLFVQSDSGATLTIAAGARVRFAPGTTMTIGYSKPGTLLVEGTAQSPVTFTSDRLAGAPGDWVGLNLGVHTTAGTSIAGLSLEFAGAAHPDGNRAGLLFQAVHPISVTASRFANNRGAGFLARTSPGSVSFGDTAFESNETHGLDVRVPATLGTALGANSFSGNGQHPVSVGAADVSGLSTASSYTGNEIDTIRVVNGHDVEVDTAWMDLGVPYQVAENIYVRGDTSPVLTIHDGVTVLFDGGTGLRIGHGDPGDLVIAGSDVGVLLTSASSGGPGSWPGLFFGSSATAQSVLTGVTIEHAGADTSPLGLTQNAAIFAYYSVVSLVSSTLRDNLGKGFLGVSSTLSLSDSVIRGTVATTTASLTDGDGVVLQSSNSTVGIWLRNTITENDGYPVRLPVGALIALDTASTFTGNGMDVIFGRGGPINHTGTWSMLDVPFYISESSHIHALAGATEPAVLTVQDATVLMELGAAFKAGDQGPGDLVLAGATFTSVADSPAPGDWEGIVFGTQTSSISSVSESTVAYGGKQTIDADTGNLYLSAGTTVGVSGTQINNSAAYGIFCPGGCASHAGSFSNNTFADNALADTN